MKHKAVATSIAFTAAAGVACLLVGYGPPAPGRAAPAGSAQSPHPKPDLSPADALRKVEAVLPFDAKLPARLPSGVERQIETLVDRVDWAKADLGKAGRRLPDIVKPAKPGGAIGQDGAAQAYALIYAAEDAVMDRPQVVLEDAGLLPARNEGEATDLKKEIELHCVQSGPDRGYLKPFRWHSNRIAYNMTMSKTWPWKRDRRTGLLSLGPVYWEPVPDIRDVIEPVSDYYWKAWRDRKLRPPALRSSYLRGVRTIAISW